TSARARVMAASAADLAAGGRPGPAAAEDTPEAGHQHTYLLSRRGWRALGPEDVGQAVHRHRTTPGQRQDLEHGPALTAPQRLLTDTHDRETAEDPDPHPARPGG
ncbi:MAG: hypothetical protein ACRD0D_03520, partial [Acidimicrobiales bacterium]